MVAVTNPEVSGPSLIRELQGDGGRNSSPVGVKAGVHDGVSPYTEIEVAPAKGQPQKPRDENTAEKPKEGETPEEKQQRLQQEAEQETKEKNRKGDYLKEREAITPYLGRILTESNIHIKKGKEELFAGRGNSLSERLLALKTKIRSGEKIGTEDMSFLQNLDFDFPPIGDTQKEKKDNPLEPELSIMILLGHYYGEGVARDNNVVPVEFGSGEKKRLIQSAKTLGLITVDFEKKEIEGIIGHFFNTALDANPKRNGDSAKKGENEETEKAPLAKFSEEFAERLSAVLSHRLILTPGDLSPKGILEKVLAEKLGEKSNVNPNIGGVEIEEGFENFFKHRKIVSSFFEKDMRVLRKKYKEFLDGKGASLWDRARGFFSDIKKEVREGATPLPMENKESLSTLSRKDMKAWFNIFGSGEKNIETVTSSLNQLLGKNSLRAEIVKKVGKKTSKVLLIILSFAILFYFWRSLKETEGGGQQR